MRHAPQRALHGLFIHDIGLQFQLKRHTIRPFSAYKNTLSLGRDRANKTPNGPDELICRLADLTGSN
jgi:hypothetical protein